MSDNLDFDMQAAWLRRFKADAESNLKAFALRLKEAMPELVTVHESRGFFSSSGKRPPASPSSSAKTATAWKSSVAGWTAKDCHGGAWHRAPNTKAIDPAEWFAKILAGETKKATEHAKALSHSLSQFMVS